MSQLYETLRPEGGVPIKAWIRGVPLEQQAEQQLVNVSRLPFVFRWIAAMPDVHAGIGATIGSVIPTEGAIIPAAVGVDIGCGVSAQRTDLSAGHLPDDLSGMRRQIERAVPHGRTAHGGRADRGSWKTVPKRMQRVWKGLEEGYREIVAAHPGASPKRDPAQHLGTLGTGNHFIEVCLDEEDRVWLMLHSGSRGVGNRIGTYFIDRARRGMGARAEGLADRDLAWLSEGTPLFDDYVRAVGWAQSFAAANRRLMMESVLEAVGQTPGMRRLRAEGTPIDCHHNYVQRETHFGREVFVTRKGAVRAGEGELGIVPGSMGAKSFVVRGRGNPESFLSCSHGAGRAMSRRRARSLFSVEQHARDTAGVECRKDPSVLDETPAAYKPIEAVMDAQKDLVEVLHTLRQVVCVKG